MSYTGDVSCQQVWEELTRNPKAVLVDVRTTQEWATIGVPDLNSLNKKTIFIEWQMFPAMQPNEQFAEQVELELKSRDTQKDDPIFFLCRSGVRSQGAASALAAQGYSKTYNILSGFEGPPDASGARGAVSGWQFDQLPCLKE